MAGRLLVRGMIAGMLAACLAFLLAKIYGETSVDLAINFEAAADAAAGQAPEVELVSRAVQSTWGLATAILMYGIAYGGIFSLVFGFAYGRVNSMSARNLSMFIALAGFVVFYFMPILKYPPNPPAVGIGDTIGIRTQLYFEAMILSIVCAILGLIIYNQLRKYLDVWDAAIIGLLTYLVVFGLTQTVLQDINEVPVNFPATILWHFREAAIGIQIVLWGSMGLIFGKMVQPLFVTRQI